MNTSSRILVLSALACTGIYGCQPAEKEAGKDTIESQVKAQAESVMKPVEPVPAPAAAAEPQAKPAPQGQIKEAAPPKTKAGQTAQATAASVAAAAAAASARRADSIKQAQEKAEATRIARLDSVKRAEAAKAAAAARTEPVVPAGAGQLAEGKTLYEENCRKCHGVRGVPPKTIAAKFPKIMPFDAAFFAKNSDASVVTVLTNGKNEDMKSFKDKLSRGQMVAVAAYIRSFR